MRILTVSASPYLFNKLGRINSDILKFLKNNNIEVASAVWHLNTSWYLPENNKYYYETSEEKICQIYPISSNPKESSSNLYDVVKEFKPDVVLSIGDYTETGFIYALKTIDPSLFKWIAIFTIDSPPINEGFYEIFDYIDYAISVNKFGQKELEKLVKTIYIPYGPNKNFTPNKKHTYNLTNLMCNAKNSQTTNLPAFISAMNNIYLKDKTKAYIHTNISDIGDYDLKRLTKRFNLDNIKFPNSFTSIHGGLTDYKLNVRYNKADIFVDPSVRASTALSMLEAMSTGCIPLGTNVGVIGEVLSLFPEEYELIVDSETYYGNCEKEYKIISPTELSIKIQSLINLKEGNYSKFMEIKNKAIEIAKMFSNEKFLKEIFTVIQNVIIEKDNFLKVEEI